MQGYGSLNYFWSSVLTQNYSVNNQQLCIIRISVFWSCLPLIYFLAETAWIRFAGGRNCFRQKLLKWQKLLMAETACGGNYLAETAFGRNCLAEIAWRKLLGGNCLAEITWRKLLGGNCLAVFANWAMYLTVILGVVTCSQFSIS